MALRCRKNQATLTAGEKSRYVAAVLTLKANGTYDRYVADHVGAMAAAHRGPAFLPWHREYLRRFELDLQAIDPGVTLPYWDWTVDTSPTASLWDPSFMGGNGRPIDGQVTSGPFAFATGNWTLIHDGPALRRRFGVSTPSLPAPGDVTGALAETVYDVPPYTLASPSGFRNRLEGWISGPQLHNRVHVWIGGSMGPMSSPNDPVFFLHHCFIDKVWADWQRLHPGAGYVPVSGAAPGHNLGNAMQPWLGRGETVTPASVLDHHALGYAYDNEIECRPKLKFLDDVPTLKFRDDIPTLKFIDDPVTLKFRDDLPTLKFRDDIPTLKFNDDPGKLKFTDDPGKLKFSDDPGTVKAIDDVKAPFLDDPGGGKFLTDGGDPLQGMGDPLQGAAVGRQAPFVLSTPHHSMAWAQDQPAALQAALAQAQQHLSQLAAALADGQEAQRQGQLTADESEQFRQLREEYESVLAECQQLAQAGQMAGVSSG